MKSLKLLLSVLALTALASAPALRAQDAPPATPPPAGQGPGGHRHMDPSKEEAHMKAQIAKLTLTSAQQTTINGAFADWEKQLTALQAATTKDQKQPIFAAIKADRKQIFEALTPDQKAQLKAMNHHPKPPAPSSDDSTPAPSTPSPAPAPAAN